MNTNFFQRCLSTKNQDGNTIDPRPDLYKPSTEKNETRVPSDLKGGQPPETIDTAPKITPTLTGSGKVW